MVDWKTISHYFPPDCVCNVCKCNFWFWTFPGFDRASSPR